MLVAVLGLLCAVAVGAAEPPGNPFPAVARAYLVQTNGEVLWQKNPHARLPPASLTKLMTALLVAEQVPPGTPVTVGRAAARETGSRLGLHAGEVYRAGDLLLAMLVASANDACRALAEHVGGDQTGFVRQMNQRAQQLGLRNTRFTNACGHDAPGHYASAHDVLQLAQAVVQVPQLAHAVAQTQSQIASIDQRRSFKLKASNALLGRYRGALGIKTGNTPGAGACLVALVRRGEHEVLVVLLGARDRWWDAADLLDIALAQAATHAPAPH